MNLMENVFVLLDTEGEGVIEPKGVSHLTFNSRNCPKNESCEWKINFMDKNDIVYLEIHKNSVFTILPYLYINVDKLVWNCREARSIPSIIDFCDLLNIIVAFFLNNIRNQAVSLHGMLDKGCVSNHTMG